MAQGFRAVDWNDRKKRYDIWIAGLSGLFLALFALGMIVWNPDARPETVLLRATGTLALVQLHVILAIGPVARLRPAFLPLLYNRRHLGVSMALVASVHAVLALFQFYALGNVPWLVSLIGTTADPGSVATFPFQLLGFLAWLQLLLMAGTSHDAWLAILGPRAWKTLHMGVYAAYALLVGHVLLGVVQLEQSPWGYGSLGLGALVLVLLHVRAAGVDHADPITGAPKAREGTPSGEDPGRRSLPDAGYVRLGPARSIPEDRARLLRVGDTAIAVFRHRGGVSAVQNACRHQGGPLAEGRVIDGCITCPWHGWQYRPEDGCSPSPFEEKLATFRVLVEPDGEVWVHPEPLPPGTPVAPAPIPERP